MKKLFLLTLWVAVGMPLCAAVYTWDGSGTVSSPAELFDEDNWGAPSGAIFPGSQPNPMLNSLVMNSGVASAMQGTSAKNLFFDRGQSITMTGGKLSNAVYYSATGLGGISGIDFGSLETGGDPTVALNMSGYAEVATQYLADVWATLTGNSILRLNGSARAINWAAIIDLSTAHKNAKIHFINWTPDQLINGKNGNSLLNSTYTNGSTIRVNGIVVTQSNYSGLVAIESDGAVGSYVYVPEPATLVILAVGSLLCLRRK